MKVAASFCLLFFQFLRCSGFADWMVKEFCERPLAVDEIIMNSRVVSDTTRAIRVFRGEVELENGGHYDPGETLRVELSSGPSGSQHVFECTPNARFEKGGCNGVRSSANSAFLVMPKPAVDPVNIWAGWATGHAEVKLTDVFSLVSTNSDGSPPLKTLSTQRTLEQQKNSEMEEPVEERELSEEELASLVGKTAEIARGRRKSMSAKTKHRKVPKKKKASAAVSKQESSPPVALAETKPNPVKIELHRQSREAIDKEKLKLALRGHEQYVLPGVQQSTTSTTHYFMFLFFAFAAVVVVLIFKLFLGQRFKIQRQILRMRGYEVDK